MLESIKDLVGRTWRKGTRYAVNWLEDDGLDEPTAPADMAHGVETNPYRAFESFSHSLPHIAYAEEDGLFLLESPAQLASAVNPTRIEAVSFTLELTPLAGAGEDLRQSIKNILIQCPPRTGVQWIVFGDPRIKPVLGHFERQSTNPLYQRAAQRRVEYWSRASTSGIFPGQPYRLRTQRLLLCITFPVDDFESSYEIDRVITTRTAIEGILNKEQMQPRRWTPRDLIEWMDYMGAPHLFSESMAPHRSFNYNPKDPLRNQLISRDTVMRVRPKHLTFGTDQDEVACVRAMSAQEYPESTQLWRAAELLGDTFNTNNQYPCPYMITLGIITQDFDSRRQVAKMAGSRATTNAQSYMAQFLPEMAEKKKDWDNVNASFARGEGDCLMFHQVLLFAREAELDEAERCAEHVWRAQKFQLTTDRYMQFQGYLSSVPMCLTPSLQHDITKTERYYTKTLANAVDTTPVCGDWRGFGEPKIMLWSRNGSPMYVDFFANEAGNYNISVAAGSGAGKSVFGNELIRSIIAGGGRAFVIDAGRSYQKSCGLARGQFIEFTRGYTPNFNPFPMIQDLGDAEAFEDVVRMISGIVASMVAPERLLDDYERGICEEVVQEEVMSKGQNGSFTGVYERLIAFKSNQTGAPDPTAGAMAQSMRSYTENGIYGRYFRGGDPIQFTNDFVVLELDGLDNAAALQSTVLMIVMFQITQAMYADRSRRKLVLIDEAWSLMRAGATGKFVEAMYRRCRKYNGCATTITQSFGDYFVNPTTLAAYNNSDWRVALRQKPEAIEAAFTEKQLTGGDAVRRAMLSLSTVAGQYSEMLISGPQGWGVGRLIVDPFTLLQFSTKAEDYEAVKFYLDQGWSTVDAIEAVLQERRMKGKQ
jgi:conjugal transfer ATP-binding protein TraC